MEKIIFKVRGSDPEPYKVTFTKDNSIVNAFCTCRAGINGQYCKHRFSIMAGNNDAVVSDNGEKVILVNSWIPGSNVEVVLCELAEAEHEKEKATRRLSAAKKNVAKAMRTKI